MRKGFTLVELAIVLVIIGLLIGGILAAQSIVETTRTQKTIREVDQYRIAVRQFQYQFKALPGDFNKAWELWGTACEATEALCEPAPGNNVVYEGWGNSWGLFWTQLSLANFVPVKYGWDYFVMGPGEFTHLRPGIEVPTAVIKGRPVNGLSSSSTYIMQNNVYNEGGSEYTYNTPYKNIFVLVSMATSSGANWVPNGSILTPVQAQAIDSKIDDGKPATGSVLGAIGRGSANCVSPNNTSPHTASPLPTAYDLNTSPRQVRCVIGFLFDDIRHK